MNRHLFEFGLLFLLVAAGVANGQSVSPHRLQGNNKNQEATDPNSPIGYYNWKLKTMGGQQFWTDVRNVSGWRVQGNSETGHFRLLSPSNTRNAWGNQLHCNEALDQLIKDGKASSCQGRVVIILHGLIRTSDSMHPIADYLERKGEFSTINFGYASTRNGVGDHAAALRCLIEHLGPEVTEINFVGHSLGNIVVRRYLADATDPKTGAQGDSRVNRIVMIAPPNQGSRVARLLKNSFLFHTIAGKAGAELSRGWDSIEPTLATPTGEFGIIAGGQATEKDFSNFVLKGKDDFTVSVEETKLAGADDFLVRPWLHSTIMKEPQVLGAVLSFLQDGYFISEDDRVRIADSKNGEESKRSEPTLQRSTR